METKLGKIGTILVNFKRIILVSLKVRLHKNEIKSQKRKLGCYKEENKKNRVKLDNIKML
jgi:hypothetical protein